MEMHKIPIDVNISHMIFATESGTILSDLNSTTNIIKIKSYDNFISMVFNILLLCDLRSGNFCFTETALFKNQVYLLERIVVNN